MRDIQTEVITIGIPTYYGGWGLVKTVQSIFDSQETPEFGVVVTVDGNPLDMKIKKALLEIGAEIRENADRRGQLGRIKELIDLVDTDYLVLTQDDVLFTPTTIKNIYEAFTARQNLTMIGCSILPVAAQNIFERIVEVGVRLTHRIGKQWGGDNYLLASGRCLAFRSKHCKSFSINDTVINSDAYLYFLNKYHSGTFSFLETAVVYNKSPGNFSEHLKQSRKFQMSFTEISRLIKQDLTGEYQVPRVITAKAFLAEFIHNPFLLTGYVFVSVLARIFGSNMYGNASRFWATDISTKQI